MKKNLLLIWGLNLILGVTVAHAQFCINYELVQNDIGIVSPTFGVSLADFNGDGWLDVVTIDAYADIEVYFNDGTGLMDTNAYTLGVDRWRFDVHAFDIDNDGDIDFVTSPMSSQSYGMEVWKNDGSGVFTLKSDNTANHSSGYDFAVGDVNNDGYDDIFFPNSDKVGIYLNDGTGNFIDNGQELDLSSPEGAVLFDADNDGDLDAAVASGFTAAFFTNDGTGHFTEAQNNMADDTEAVDAADFNKDGYMDLIFVDWHGYPQVWINDGLGLFLPGIVLDPGSESFYDDVIARDINYDNLPDIITQYYIFQNNPEDPGTFIMQGYLPNSSTHDFDVNDINNDGFLDVYMGIFSGSDGDKIDYYVPGTMLYADTTLCFGDSLLVGGIWETEPGEYMGSAGCDSTITVNISFFDEINTNVTFDGNALIAEATGVLYQWINCADSSFIEGANEQTFIPAETGDYAVIITDGDCSAISDCYTVVIDGIHNESLNDISIYPNPNKGVFTLKCDACNNPTELQITNTVGQIVYQVNISGKTNEIDISGLQPGIYILTLSTGSSTTFKKIIVE